MKLRRIPRAPFPLPSVFMALVLAGGLIAGPAVWTGKAWTTRPQVTARLKQEDSVLLVQQPQSKRSDIPASVLAVTLVDELFPQPPPSLAPLPPPTVDVQLVAITGSGDLRRIFVRHTKQGDYLDLGIGDSLPSGATLRSVQETSAEFEVAGATVRLELPR